MVKSKLIMKKKPMNAMEAYRKKEKNKERMKNKKDKYTHKEHRQRGEEEKHSQPKPVMQSKDDSDGFEGEEDLMEFSSAFIQQKLQEKQRLRELRFDDPVTKNSIQDLAQAFTKKPATANPQPRPTTTHTANTQAQPTGNYQTQAPSGLSSFMSDNIFRSQAQSHGQNTAGQPSKSVIGDKRLQKREGAGGSVDPFMMTTLQGNYDPTAKNKNKQDETAGFDPLMGNYVSQAPGVYKAIDKPNFNTNQPITAAPAVIVKEASLTSAPLRSQMEKEKSSLVPMNVVKKKVVKPATEEASKPNQSTMNIGIMNVTNVPAPKTNFGFSQNIQQNAAQKDQLSAFLQEISQLEDAS